jgi:hypothetical protein
MLMLAVVAFLVAIFFAFVPLSVFQTSISAVQLLNAAIIFAMAIIFAVLGLFVRAGTRRPAVISIVVTLLACGYIVAITIAALRSSRFLLGEHVPVPLICVLLAGLLVLVRWLWQAAIMAPRIAAARRRPDTTRPTARQTP